MLSVDLEESWCLNDLVIDQMKGLLLLFMSEDQGKSVPMKVSIRGDSADKWGLFLMRKGN
jgi:hypothetical protein